ncbi:MAG: DUF4349 domain-containing protein [Candidatus Sericytochromatia bacterium]|nr:DUF4349 domain-containing protein [Candidatus Sericytochromatia bacterium]
MRPLLRLAAAATLALTPLAAGCGPVKEEPVEASLEAPAPSRQALEEGRSLGGGVAMKAAAPDMAAEAPPPGAANEAARDKAAPDVTAGMYIIRKGAVTVQVADVRAGMRKVALLARETGGFVADSSYQAAEGNTPSATLTLRIPAKRFDALLDAIGGVGTVFARSIGSEDVTLSFVDTQSRIKNLRKEEALLLKMLDRTGKLTEVLEVERQLSRVSGEIEQAQGRLRHLANQVELATIEVTLSEKVQTVTHSPWGVLPSAVENAVADAQRALAGSLAGALQATIWLVMVVLPTLVLAGGLFLLVGWLLRRWVVGRALVSSAWYDRAWGGVGVALLLAWQPQLVGAFVTVVLVLVALAAGTRLWTWLGRGKQPEA